MQGPKDVEKKNDSWENDQAERGYYYDDAHGYEQFDPDCEEGMDEDGESISDEPTNQ